MAESPKLVVVQVSPSRWVIAEKCSVRDTYVVITKRISSWSLADIIRYEIKTRDEGDYSINTRNSLIES